MKPKRNLFDLDESNSREFDFSILIIMLCITFRNYFKGYGFAIHLNSDLLFEIILLLLPISLLFFNKMTDKDIANIFKCYTSLLFPFLGGILYIIIASFLIYIARFIPFIDFLFSLLGLAILIPGILNILIAILIFVTKKRVQQKESKKVND
ncbi:hypothetical protein H7914_10920 [Staphylococcus epidermidis]|uniref:hypothetical protein n=1 Tax=Staphylococcus epidermidis TaxID=1282 RepID=UPI00164268EA|nr:hypothetical protein [Staphylococcus epidermidis]MBC3005769.1 hypothetical protein [Staphylococcus epidermidis]MBC3065851.1 hypothetical protein [Staphylococcus epidermidis]MCO6264377.1 hypothetical protein [Staphylococcus epidermidis]